MELETAFYITSIAFMALMTILILILLAAVLVIKAKINKVHDSVEEKINQVQTVASKLVVGLNTVRHFVKR